MRWAFSSVGMVAAGLVGIMIILLFQELTVNNEEEYYLLKEINESAMYDSVDLAYYRDTGKLKIVQEKFVENFTRRFAQSASVLNTKNYSLEFYNIMEIPPKVSVIIRTETRDYTIFGNHLGTRSYGVSNRLDSILEYDLPADDSPTDSDCYKTFTYVSIPYVTLANATWESGDEFYGTYTHNAHMQVKPPEGGEAEWKIVGVNYIGNVLNFSQIQHYTESRGDMFYNGTSEYDIVDDIENMAEGIAVKQTLTSGLNVLRAINEGDVNEVWYSLDYTCKKGVTLESRSHGSMSDACIIGLIYTLTWQKTSEECSY